MSKKFQALGNFALKVTSQSIFDFITGIINTHKFRMTVKRKIFKPILHFPQELSKYWESFEQKMVYVYVCVFLAKQILWILHWVNFRNWYIYKS